MKPLGIITGTLLTYGKGIFANLRQETVETDFGPAMVYCNNDIFLIARHGMDPNHHTLPHLINHQANMSAMKKIGVMEIVGVHSTGTVKGHLKPGTFVVPDDYIKFDAGPTVIRERATHIVPILSAEVRRKLITAAHHCGFDCIDGGIYWQAAGPRLETRAEIAMISQFADLVGMTMASEAIIAQELNIPFASICSVDNFAHGIGEKALAMEEVLQHARKNTDSVLTILTRYVERGNAGIC
jgi:5'-methylthioadenosine phosphorylase